MVLKIPKIGFERGLVAKGSKYNTVAKNIQIIAESDMPDKENGNLIKAAATLGILAAGLMILAEAMLWINTKNALAPASLASLFASIGAIAVGTAILVAAAGALKDMSLAFKEALPYIETLGVLMLGMLGAMTVLTLIGKDHKIFTAGATTICTS